MIEVYGHGGDVETAAVKYGYNANEFIDFSANINPLGSPPELMTVLQQGLSTIARYPDPGHRALKRILSEHLGVSEEMLCFGNGAAECISLILLATAPRTVGVIQPCFSEYATLSRQFGAEIKSIEADADLDFCGEPEQIEKLISEVDLLFIGQPNNPNGVQYNVGHLRRFAEAGQRSGTNIVIDEAFIDFIPFENRHSLLREIGSYSNVVIVRSMTKFYAIPGLRLGYCIANETFIKAIVHKQVIWSVNGLALLAGEVCLKSGESYEQSVIKYIEEQRQILLQAMKQLGCRTWPSEVNYLLVRLPEGWTSSKMQDALGVRGILIRSCAMYPGLTERDIRIAVKEEEANERLLRQMGIVIGGEAR